MRRIRHPALLAAVLLVLVTSCSSMKFTRLSRSHGEFEATGWAFTIFAIDIPKHAIDIPRENLSDARQPNMRIVEESVTPYFGRLDWILDIISIRRAVIRGIWGFAPNAATGESSN